MGSYPYPLWVSKRDSEPKRPTPKRASIEDSDDERVCVLVVLAMCERSSVLRCARVLFAVLSARQCACVSLFVNACVRASQRLCVRSCAYVCGVWCVHLCTRVVCAWCAGACMCRTLSFTARMPDCEYLQCGMRDLLRDSGCPLMVHMTTDSPILTRALVEAFPGAEWLNTGGGCMVVYVPFTDGTFVYITDREDNYARIDWDSNAHVRGAWVQHNREDEYGNTDEIARILVTDEPEWDDERGDIRPVDSAAVLSAVVTAVNEYARQNALTLGTAPARIGDRVTIPAHTDAWMRGYRFGTVDAVYPSHVLVTATDAFGGHARSLRLPLSEYGNTWHTAH